MRVRVRVGVRVRIGVGVRVGVGVRGKVRVRVRVGARVGEVSQRLAGDVLWEPQSQEEQRA